MLSNILWIAGLCTLHVLSAWINSRVVRSYFQRSGKRENALQRLRILNQYCQTYITIAKVVTTSLLIAQYLGKSAPLVKQLSETEQTMKSYIREMLKANEQIYNPIDII